VYDVSFVDDLAVPVVSGASGLVPKVKMITTFVYTVFQMYGMGLNFAPGKSAVILDFRGQGTRKAMLEVFECQGSLRIDGIHCVDEVCLPVVSQYKHLGTVISFQGCAAEVAFRCGLMRAETAKLRKILRP